MPKYINADEMLQEESEAYMRAQTKITDEATYLVNHFVHIKLQQLLCDAPAADVQEVKRGKRIIDVLTPYCSACQQPSEYYCDGVHSTPLFCLNCGARMMEEKTNEN